MYAIVEFKGTQLRMEQGQTLKVPYLADKEAGSKIEIEKVLLLQDGADIKVGQPVVDSAKIIAEVVEHGREKKIIVFKKKRRKGYQKKQGHRQYFTKIVVKEIVQ